MSKWEMVQLGDVCTGVITNIAQKDLSDNNGNYPIHGASGLIKCVNFYKQDKPYIAVVKDGAGVGRVSRMPAKSSVIGTMQYILPSKDIDVNYLYYAMVRMDLARFYTGATIPHIYFKDYKKEFLPLPPPLVQQKIADALDRANASIEKRKMQIEKLDLLIKSRFIEMFGESEISDDVSLFNESIEEMFIGPFGSSLKNDCFVDEDKSFCMVYEQKHAIQKSFDLDNRYVDKSKYDELKRFTVQAGDIIVSCRGTIGETYILPKEAPMGIMHPSIMKIRLKKNVYNSVFFNELLMQFFKKNTSANGSSVKMAITAKNLGQLQLLKPSIDAQHQFADFVQAVDKSKFALQQQLEKQQFLYKSLMQKCFNGELFGNE